ncbi:MAG: hypothetical protein Q8W45_05460 [Candidatus Palauibacterales bacterium]|nr:hypothetical protein [Candidatus Palauibacterales bacterium]MDP2482707.1 hypothetical protein [Candidatus Palauibacterales bacterium]
MKGSNSFHTSRIGGLGSCLTALALAVPLAAQAQPSGLAKPVDPSLYAGQCNFSNIPGIVWWGTDDQMTVQRLASLAAPIYWFSPDEPLLAGTSGRDIRMPSNLPFEDSASAPVVYYQLDEMVTAKDYPVQEFTLDPDDKGQSMLDLTGIGLVRLGYFAYYPFEAGLGAHQHDLEAAELKIAILRTGGSGGVLEAITDARCEERNFVLVVTRVVGKAHGIEWFWNISEVDAETKMPFTLLVEEGKHATGTDKNGDGYFTPTYDVNVRVNDAWGTRDVISSGGLLSGGYQAWMTKVRYPEYRIFPPLPEDSPLRAKLALKRGAANWETDNAVYELRPLPPSELGAYDEGLHEFMQAKEVVDWPKKTEKSDLQGFIDWNRDGTVARSLAISVMYDGDLGVAWAFPFFIVRNFEVSISGGFIVHRMYIKDKNFRDFGWQALYTNSASRWFDTYLAAGVEFDKEPTVGDPSKTQTDTNFVLETGFKFRANVESIKALSWLTEFWGIRFGIKNYDFPDIKKLTYVIEFGAGAF